MPRGNGRVTARSVLSPASCQGLLAALSPWGALSSALPGGLREWEAGLGEVERFVPGQQAVGERRGG